MAFSQIERKTPNLEWENVVVATFPNGNRKSRQWHFSHYEINGRDAYEAHVAGEHGGDPRTIAFP